eukprot:NODE_1870_length_1270_cov_13.276003_g1549_i0.p1 GENE.NODE_1870_length_1270_cov_13.276003_g1549_i0~~NODE_1870_length_1270_cov_13.276003_g1549_i0.p1  ORF type:complete len:380 (+),score=63.65 NODE_1870_length_1270_cov_13.276003_g1549_i0:54-1193(+)
MKGGDDDKKKKSGKPANTPFKQQRLPAWQPILSPPWVISCFFLVATVFIPIGAIIVVASSQVLELIQPYDEMPDHEKLIPCSEVMRTRNRTLDPEPKCITVIKNIHIKETMDAPVYMYYRLEGFYQNHRRYAKSRNDAQLAGEEVEEASLDECEPKATAVVDGNKYILNPCGLIAWSMFNDSFSLFLQTGGKDSNQRALICATHGARWPDAYPNPKENHCTKNGIAWPSDQEKKFRQPPGYNNPNNSVWGYPNDYPGEPGHRIPNVTDPDFMVWMRTASLPTFRKLFRKIEQPLIAGYYTLEIQQRFPVYEFGGHKAVVLSTSTWIGGRNEFLGGAYMVVGSICFFLAVIFLVKHLVSPRAPGELNFLANNAGADAPRN